MKKLIPVFVAMFVGAGFSGVASAADNAAPATDKAAPIADKAATTPDPKTVTCQKQADKKKLAGDEAKKFVEKCIKDAAVKM